MQAILLAAGASSRFAPFNTQHKSLVKIAGEAIAIHTVRAVKRAGITDIIFVVSDNQSFQDVLGNGKKYGVKIRYVVQKTPEGMGDAVLLAEKLIDSDFFLLNSNHVEFGELKEAIDKKRNTNNEVILLAKEQKGNHFGVIKVDGDKVLSVVEKPTENKSETNLRIVGTYFLNKEFLNVLKKIKKSHYNFEDALDAFAKLGKVRVATTNTEIASLKYPWNLLHVKDIILNKITRNISKKAVIDKSARIMGNVVIEEGAQISENVVIKGPAYIGKNAFIGSNSLVRNGSDVEENSVVGGYMEVKNSLIFTKAKTHSGHLEDSILGENSRLGALFTSANVKLDRSNIVSTIKNEKIDTGARSVGAMIGSNTQLGARVTTMPGVIIGNNVSIGPSTTVMKNIESDTAYYTKFLEVVEKKKIESNPAKSKS